MRRWLPLLFFFAALAARLPVLLSHLDTWYPFEVHCGSIAMAFHDHLDLAWPILIVGMVLGNQPAWTENFFHNASTNPIE